MKTREGRKEEIFLSVFFSPSSFFFFLLRNERTITRSKREQQEERERFYCREQRERERKKEESKEIKAKREKKERGGRRRKKIKFKRFPIELREAKKKPVCTPLFIVHSPMHGNRSTTKSSLILFSFSRVRSARRCNGGGSGSPSRTSSHSRESGADPWCPFPSVRTTREWLFERREKRSTDFLREARFGRSRVSRRIGTKVSANYILSRVPRERVVIAN